MGCDFALYAVQDGEKRGENIANRRISMTIGTVNKYIHEGVYTKEELMLEIKDMTDLLAKLMVLQEILPLVEKHDDLVYTDKEDELAKITQKIFDLDKCNLLDYNGTYFMVKDGLRSHVDEVNNSVDIDAVTEAMFAYSYALTLCGDKIFVEYS